MPASALYLLLDPQESRFPSWLAIYSVQFALYGGVALYLHRRGSLPIPAVLLCALAAARQDGIEVVEEMLLNERR